MLLDRGNPEGLDGSEATKVDVGVRISGHRRERRQTRE